MFVKRNIYGRIRLLLHTNPASHTYTTFSAGGRQWQVKPRTHTRSNSR